MSDYLRLWLVQSLPGTAQREVLQAIDSSGGSLPCHVVSVSGALVTVAFDLDGVWTLPNITIPKAESPYFRQPTQVGDKGITVPCDVYLGGVSGLGGGIAKPNPRMNLEPLIFVPVSNSGSPPANQTQAIVQGPGGALIQDDAGTTGISVTSGTITVFWPGGSFDIITHDHGGVQTGGSNTTGPVSGT